MQFLLLLKNQLFLSKISHVARLRFLITASETFFVDAVSVCRPVLIFLLEILPLHKFVLTKFVKKPGPRRYNRKVEIKLEEKTVLCMLYHRKGQKGRKKRLNL